MSTDVEIAQAHTLEPITDIAARAGIPEDALITYGPTKAKVDISKIPGEASGKLILVTGISPTPAGEGKSTVLIGLSDAMRLIGKESIVAIREPSLGPVMGIKGGAAGGGYSQIVPMEEINLHFTGDFHAITSATNTLAALVDNHVQQGNELGIDVRSITWQRCMDVNDRSLREIVTGLGGKAHGTPTETGFTITAASEIMAILCLASDLDDLRERISRIVVAQNFEGEPVTVADLKVEGALTALMRDAINPNLVQTLGGTPAFVHGGPFANIAHGCNSLIATRTALKLGEVVLTEAGFGSDLGAEKFFDIKSRVGGLTVNGAVVVATVRSLKYNGGVAKDQLTSENFEALTKGVANLEAHVRNVRQFGVTPIVALNRFASDTDEEIAWMKKWAQEFGVELVPVEVWAKGGEGAIDLAKAVMANLREDSTQLYDPSLGIEASIETIATNVYSAGRIHYSWKAEKDLKYLKENGWDTLPVCISKTQYSFSDEPSQLGAAEGHTLHVRKLLPRIGSGFIVALTGDVMTMPGLPKKPAALGIDVEDGMINGLF
ncbi:formate--tetrahydrofolate ligase [Corynebacterium vitaeruminis]|uniref:Formate--tetrahydrofolate ligase n=1 Tax=Corynebacterium vitaeruminis DSM 20294 TaxID=1224164 RepID=W5Y1N1_9CORY|nr:formate--tetrahydrofolate ligase [Corynebacterium vitaeruminis]AHI22800.1 formate--tetrahydrofolate ligase [Corynebacterium vitaeruminis DSM 20294]